MRSVLGARGALDMRLGAVTAAVCVGLSATLLALAVITFVLGTDQGAGDLHRHAAPVFAPLAGLVSVVLLAWATLFVSLGSEVRGLADDERATVEDSIARTKRGKERKRKRRRKGRVTRRRHAEEVHEE